MPDIEYPRPPLPPQQQDRRPGLAAPMNPPPDHGESTYKGSNRLTGKVALITGADSGIGRAVAIAFAREGADVAIAYLDEHDDAKDTSRWVEQAGRRALLLPGDITNREHCKAIVAKTAETFGRIDVLVNNAAYQATYDKLEDISVPRSEVGTSFPNSRARKSVIRLVAVPGFTFHRCELNFNLMDEEK